MPELPEPVLQALGAAVAATLMWCLSSIARAIRARTENALARNFLEEVEDLSHEVVVSLNQSKVGDLKKKAPEGLDKLLQEVKAEAVTQVKLLLPNEEIERFEKRTGNSVETLINHTIERAVHQQTRGYRKLSPETEESSP